MGDLSKSSILVVLCITVVISFLIGILDFFPFMSTQNSAHTGTDATAPANTNLIATDNYEAAALRPEAVIGNINAARKLGFLYAEGVDVPKNQAEAARWLQFAADHGDICAQAGQYEFGLAGAESKEMAFSLYTKAAQTGDDLAQYRLGLFYYNGFGVAKDDAQAKKWYQKAANQGNAEAESALQRLKVSPSP
jgi:TPR repeat protein